MDDEIRDFLEGLVHGPCAGVDYKQFADYCQRTAKLLLTKDEQKKFTVRRERVPLDDYAAEVKADEEARLR